MMCYGDDVGIFSSGELVNVRVWGGMLHRLVIVSARFDGVGAWRVRRNSAVFLRSRDRGSEDAVVFSGIGDDGFFDHTGCPAGLMIRRGPRSREAVQQRRNEPASDDAGFG